MFTFDAMEGNAGVNRRAPLRRKQAAPLVSSFVEKNPMAKVNVTIERAVVLRGRQELSPQPPCRRLDSLCGTQDGSGYASFVKFVTNRSSEPAIWQSALPQYARPLHADIDQRSRPLVIGVTAPLTCQRIVPSRRAWEETSAEPRFVSSILHDVLPTTKRFPVTAMARTT